MRETIETLLGKNVVPVVNENDSISDEELKFGDNDVLSALLASITQADFLIILTTAKGLMKSISSNILVPFVSEITEEIEDMAGGTASSTAVGGMVTKIEAAKVATKSGCAVFIGSGETYGRFTPRSLRVKQKELFCTRRTSSSNQEKWLCFLSQSQRIH